MAIGAQPSVGCRATRWMGWPFVVLAAVTSVLWGAFLMWVAVQAWASIPLPEAGLVAFIFAMLYLGGGLSPFLRRPWAYEAATWMVIGVGALFPIGTLISLFAIFGLKNNRHRFDGSSAGR